MRKFLSLGALLFMLGAALVSKPVFALPLCDCDFCAFSPNSWCLDDEHGGFRFHCYEYTYFYCP
jgi:hypothetical protein